MTAIEFFVELLKFAGEAFKSIIDKMFYFAPVNIVLSVLLGVLVLGIVLSILRGRRL